MSTRPGGLATWQNALNWDDDDEQDSDTDSKLSGSAIVDSVIHKDTTIGVVATLEVNESMKRVLEKQASQQKAK